MNAAASRLRNSVDAGEASCPPGNVTTTTGTAPGAVGDADGPVERLGVGADDAGVLVGPNVGKDVVGASDGDFVGSAGVV